MNNGLIQTTPVRIALIGVSGYGRAHLRTIKTLIEQNTVQLTAATVINQDEEKETCQELREMGCHIYADYQEMLDDQRGNIDLCAIPTGISLHRQMTEDALAAGCNVLVEKPAAATLEEVDAMIAKRDETGFKVFVGFQDLFNPVPQNIKQTILDGHIGKLKTIRVIGSWPRPNSYYARNNWSGRISANGKLVYDSPANNAMAHYLIAALYFAGETFTSVAKLKELKADLYRAKPIESFDTISARILTENGIDIVFTVTHSAQEMIHPILDIIGEEGSIKWEISNGFTLQPTGKVLSYPAGDLPRLNMFNEVIRSLKTGDERHCCTLEMAREHTRTIVHLHENCKIQDIPESSISIIPAEDGDRLITIKGLERYLWESLATGKLLSELNPSWV